MAGRERRSGLAADPATPARLRSLCNARFGVATGPAVVGNVGTPDRLNHTVLGDTVNLAARLGALKKAYGTAILVDAATAEAAPDAAVFCRVDRVAVKGKAAGVAVFAPLSATPEARRLAAPMAEALAAYAAGDFVDSLPLLRDAAALRPDRPAMRVSLSRCESLAADPPASWYGVARAPST